MFVQRLTSPDVLRC